MTKGIKILIITFSLFSVCFTVDLNEYVKNTVKDVLLDHNYCKFNTSGFHHFDCDKRCHLPNSYKEQAIMIEKLLQKVKQLENQVDSLKIENDKLRESK